MTKIKRFYIQTIIQNAEYSKCFTRRTILDYLIHFNPFRFLLAIYIVPRHWNSSWCLPKNQNVGPLIYILKKKCLMLASYYYNFMNRSIKLSIHTFDQKNMWKIVSTLNPTWAMFLVTFEKPRRAG